MSTRQTNNNKTATTTKTQAKGNNLASTHPQKSNEIVTLKDGIKCKSTENLQTDDESLSYFQDK